jgi:hypothetical protein
MLHTIDPAWGKPSPDRASAKSLLQLALQTGALLLRIGGPDRSATSR